MQIARIMCFHRFIVTEYILRSFIKNRDCRHIQQRLRRAILKR